SPARTRLALPDLQIRVRCTEVRCRSETAAETGSTRRLSKRSTVSARLRSAAVAASAAGAPTATASPNVREAPRARRTGAILRPAGPGGRDTVADAKDVKKAGGRAARFRDRLPVTESASPDEQQTRAGDQEPEDQHAPFIQRRHDRDLR